MLRKWIGEANRRVFLKSVFEESLASSVFLCYVRSEKKLCYVLVFLGPVQILRFCVIFRGFKRPFCLINKTSLENEVLPRWYMCFLLEKSKTVKKMEKIVKNRKTRLFDRCQNKTWYHQVPYSKYTVPAVPYKKLEKGLKSVQFSVKCGRECWYWPAWA